ncbi:hypothetical protein RhiJN_09728 [Ceratobasidium sp. AG-Ba]|nr:hypothetical protein RhiJN_09728 [Ceratobasidium sp. AG-Ba]QRW10469.1 hypothetical protein RhiLY_09468 [Ceratobasidium sp. AG-Ba]
MLSFARLSSFLLFVLSLSFLTCAAPTLQSSELSVRDYGNGDNSDSYSPANKALEILVGLQSNVQNSCDLMVTMDTLDKINLEVTDMAGHVNQAAETLLGLGPLGVDINAEIVARISATVYAIIKILVKAFATVSLKFGITAVLAIWVKIDTCLHLLLVNLDVCVHGIIAVVLKLVVDVDVKLYIKNYMSLCATLLALLG